MFFACIRRFKSLLLIHRKDHEHKHNLPPNILSILKDNLNLLARLTLVCSEHRVHRTSKDKRRLPKSRRWSEERRPSQLPRTYRTPRTRKAMINPAVKRVWMRCRQQTVAGICGSPQLYTTVVALHCDRVRVVCYARWWHEFFPVRYYPAKLTILQLSRQLHCYSLR